VPKNEDGEFELILGNRQLLSVFFIVVILLGVFFTMGYIVGRNSSPVTTPEIASQPRPEPRPAAAEPAPSREPAPEPAKDTPLETARQQPPAPEAHKAPEPAAQEPAKPAPIEKGAPKKELPAYKTLATAQSNAQPAAGQTYLQLAATVKHEADAMVEVLRKNGFASAAQEVPEKPGVFRVLVGPLHEDAINKTRSDLQNKGFPGNIAIKKTF
jgi:cytoskeletal protein RodZ